MPPRRGTKRKAAPAAARSNTKNDSDTEETKKPKLEEKGGPELEPAENSSPPSNNNGNHENNDDPLRRPHHLASLAEQHDIVLRKYYPAEMSNERAQAYIDGILPRPFDQLISALDDAAPASRQIQPKGAIIHWFRTDLRLHDNRALSLASQTAHDAGIPLVCVYLVSPQDFEAHSTSPIRIDFILRTLSILRRDLARLDIPLHIETVPSRSQIPARIASFADSVGASHVYANMEYEVDELRRDAKLVRLLMASKQQQQQEEEQQGRSERKVGVSILHDTCVVPPGTLASGAGKPYAVYTPYYKAWMARLDMDPGLLIEVEGPSRNPPREKTREDPRFAGMFLSAAAAADGDHDDDGEIIIIPAAPEGFALEDHHHHDAKACKRLRALWPAGEHEARRRLGKFCGVVVGDDEDAKKEGKGDKGKKSRIEAYAQRRNFPAAGGEEGDSGATSALSVHLAAGTLSARECVRVARRKEKGRGAGDQEGVRTWVSEVAWRDFYRHVVVAWPFVCMSKPFKPIYANIPWSYSESDFEAWCQGRTGYPIVDAAMRQMAATGWMHNRPRMITASFLAKDLLQDWRKGEQFFMKNLVDGDLASNNGGWGFSASVGVDPQPYFRVFNPTLQGEKFDPDGTYVRKWVPELRDVASPAIHDPYARGAGKVARKNGYPEKIVDHKVARDRALQAYKGVLGKA